VTEYQSRRERREAEAAQEKSRRSPEKTSALQASDTLTPPRERAAMVTEAAVRPAEAWSEQTPAQSIDPHAGLTRRERRMVESGDNPPERVATTPPPSMVIAQSLTEVDQDQPEARAGGSSGIASGESSDSMFTGTNLLSEPKTQSIVLPVVPELALPSTSTGEILTTGSISILSEPVESIITGSLDGIELDRLGAADAVTGALSVVQPVSALTVIRERESVAVVPTRTLRRGWWQPWLIGAAALLMLGAAIFTTLLILEAVGG